MNIQKSLKSLLEAGLTQSEIAKEIGCSQAHVSDMVNGKAAVKRPTLKIVSGIGQLMLAHKKGFPKTELPPTPAILPDDLPAAALLNGLSGKFGDGDAVAWFLQLPKKLRSEVFEMHDCITSAICIEVLNRVNNLKGGLQK